MKRALLALAAGMLAYTNPTSAQNFNQFVGFGDSSIDSGYFKKVAAPSGDP